MQKELLIFLLFFLQPFNSLNVPQWSVDWMLGWSPDEPLHLKENFEETLERELKQVNKIFAKPITSSFTRCQRDGREVRPTRESPFSSGGNLLLEMMVFRPVGNISAMSLMIVLTEIIQCSGKSYQSSA